MRPFDDGPDNGGLEPGESLPGESLPGESLPGESSRAGRVIGGRAPGGIRPVRRRRSRPPSSGVGAILLVDLLALMIVLASAPAAWLWLDSSHPSPVAAAVATPPAAGSPGPGGSAEPGQSPGASAAASASPAPGASPKLLYGSGVWATAAPLPQGAWASGGASLKDGRVLVVGGATAASSNSATNSATIFDPATGRWSVATHMLQARAYPMAVTLSDGSVLAVGGSRNLQPLDTAERYSPDNGTWVAAGRLNLPRTQATLTLLSDGRVLVVGGGIEGSPGWRATASAEIFDPIAGTWSLAAPMSVARAFQTATLLPNGEVLVAGGASTYNGTKGTVTATAEIYNPRSNQWRPAARLSVARYADAAAILPGGRVLVAGGWSFTTDTDPSLASSETYDPATNAWTVAEPLHDARGSLSMVSLPDGRVLAMAGVDPAYHVLASTEIYDPKLGTWQVSGQLPVALERPATAILQDGRVLVAGGTTEASAGHVTAVCALYTAPAPK